jgi:hypothetical protein
MQTILQNYFVFIEDILQGKTEILKYIQIYIFYMLDWLIGIFFQDLPNVLGTLLLESITFFNTFEVFH